MGPPGGAALVDDLDHVVDLARDDGADLPVLLFAHSLGSLIGLAYLTRHSDRLAGAVLCGFPASLVDLPVLGEALGTITDEATRDSPGRRAVGVQRPVRAGPHAVRLVEPRRRGGRRLPRRPTLR